VDIESVVRWIVTCGGRRISPPPKPPPPPPPPPPLPRFVVIYLANGQKLTVEPKSWGEVNTLQALPSNYSFVTRVELTDQMPTGVPLLSTAGFLALLPLYSQSGLPTSGKTTPTGQTVLSNQILWGVAAALCLAALVLYFRR
jgi:hypothetical protein